MKKELETLAASFKHFADQAMKQSEDANASKNWVKGERKETESETWMEAHRIVNKLLTNTPEQPPHRADKYNPCDNMID
jgi:hypothetical protein